MEEKLVHCITLRPFELGDLSNVMTWLTDDRVAKWCWWDALQCRNDVQSFLEISLIACGAWAICLDGCPVGQVTFKQGVGTECCRGEIGYAVAYDHWGKGIATQALKMAVSTIFSHFPGIKRIDALTTDTNIGSQRVLEKAGFMKEGLLKKYRVKNGEVLDKVIFSTLSTT